jgi:hypothetical protein
VKLELGVSSTLLWTEVWFRAWILDQILFLQSRNGGLTFQKHSMYAEFQRRK